MEIRKVLQAFRKRNDDNRRMKYWERIVGYSRLLEDKKRFVAK
jgi:hypothetical protein